MATAAHPYKEIQFDLVITEPGAGELVITADSHAGPNLDKFEFTAKDLLANTYTITASAEEHGIITPSGAVSVEEGDSQTFTMTADRGYEGGGRPGGWPIGRCRFLLYV